LARKPDNSRPASGEDLAEVGSRKVDFAFVANEPENSHPASGEDLSFSNGTEMGM
jgi:hypothetical protein